MTISRDEQKWPDERMVRKIGDTLDEADVLLERAWRELSVSAPSESRERYASVWNDIRDYFARRIGGHYQDG